MAELYSQFTSGTQITAGTIVGSILGASGLNAFADRINSITTDNGLVTGSVISGTNTLIFAAGGNLSNSGFFQSISAQSTTSSSFVDYTGGSVVITTGSNPILCMAKGVYNGTTGEDTYGHGYVQISRDNETDDSYGVGLFVLDDSAEFGFSDVWIDRPGSGIHTYKVQFRKSSSDSVGIDDVSLACVELKNHV